MNVDSLTEFERLTLKAQLNFCERAEHVAYFAPNTPYMSKPYGTKYFALLERMLQQPVKRTEIQAGYQQMFRWAGFCTRTKDGYTLTDFGKRYVKAVQLEVEFWKNSGRWLSKPLGKAAA